MREPLPLPFPLVAGLLALALLLLAAAATWWWRARARRLREQRRAAGYQLMDCLKAYSAWMDYHRDEPLMDIHPDELSVPPPLLRASRIKDQWFPELAQAMVRLLKSHEMMMAYLWEQNILRMGGGSMSALKADRRWQELRDLQDATLDSLFMRCRQAIGDDRVQWHRTRSDFSFSSGLSLPSQPHTPT